MSHISWWAFAAVLLPSGGLFTIAWQAGRWAGRVNAVLDELRSGHDDHEGRMRVLERRRRR